MKEVILAKSAGFCFGVQRAMDTVYAETGNKNVYTYGPIIHNTEVVNELESKGVKAVNDISEIPEPEESTVIIRSHGVSKAVYEEQFEGIDLNKPTTLVSQTTFNYKKFQDLVEIIKKKEYNICISNTICNATEERQNEARRIARRADAMIVIGDSSSSNTRKLYEICKTECQETFYIQTLSGLELDKLKSSDCIGITAGASTPNNIIEEVYTSVRRKLCTDVR